MNHRQKLQLAAWKERLSALKNLPPVMRILWRSGSELMAAAMTLRALIAVLPFASLWIAKRIVDLIVVAIKQPQPVPHQIWYLLAAEFTVGALGVVLSRGIDYCDGRMADRFSRELTVRVMEHAATLDLESFEDPTFYDKLLPVPILNLSINLMDLAAQSPLLRAFGKGDLCWFRYQCRC